MTDSGKCYFASDLHLFANRSNAHRYLDEIAHAAAHAGAFVLGGDTFDFPWADSPIHRTVDRALGWLSELTASCPRCRFHLVLGNHDYHQVFLDRLADFAPTLDNFQWYPFYVRLGSAVFLHGDVAGRMMDARALCDSRQRWLDHERRSELANMVYDMVVATGMHKPLPHVLFSKRLVVRRIHRYLQSIGQGPDDGVEDVYFGHTHKRMVNYYYRGLHFHNGGAPIKGLKFRILEARVHPYGSAALVRG